MNTIELSKRELRVLEVIIDKMEEISLSSNEKVYRIRNIFVLLYNHFKESESPISRQAVHYSIGKLEKAGLLKVVAKTQTNKDGEEKFVHELQLEKFDNSKIIEIKKHYQARKKSTKTEKQPKLDIKLNWFKLVPINPMSQLEIEILHRRDEILQEMARLEEALKEANNALALAREARKFLQKKEGDGNIYKKVDKFEDTQMALAVKEQATKKVLMLLRREEQVLQGIVEYLSKTGGNQIIGMRSTLSKHFSTKNVKISDGTIFQAVKGLEEVGFLRVIDHKEMMYNKQKILVYQFNKELFNNSEIFVQDGLRRNLVSKSLRKK